MTKKRNPENEDAELWKQITETVSPLKGRQKPAAEPDGHIQQTEPDTETRHGENKEHAASFVTRPSAPPLQPAPSNLSQGPAAGLDKRTAQRLKRGQLAIDGRIDLHGHTLDQAQAAFSDFIHRSRANGKRCLLVITGKGGGTGVIRAALPGWLGGGNLSPAVLAFSPAQPKDGGGGAFYILLRKKPKKPNFFGI